MYTKLICALFISTCILACNHESKNIKSDASSFEVAHESPSGKSALEEPIPVETGQQVSDSTTSNTSSNTNSLKSPVVLPPIDWTRKIVKSGNVKVEVKNFRDYNQKLYDKVKQYGGYIAQEEASLTDEKSETAVTIKVPVQQFDGLVNDLTNIDGKVLQKNIQSADVTGDVANTKARLEAKKQMRLKYLELMKDSKNMAEVLQVQNEVNGIQEEIEAATGRYASLSNQSAYSTLTLTFFQVIGSAKTDSSPGFFSRTEKAFSIGSEFIGDLFLGLLSIWPLLVLIIGGWVIYRKRRLASVAQKS